MQKGLYIRSSNDREVINFYFTDYAVTVRTFIHIRSGRELEIAQKPNADFQDVRALFEQNYEESSPGFVFEEGSDQSDSLAKRQEQRKKMWDEKLRLAKLSALNTKALTESEQNYQGRYVVIDNELYKICKQTKFEMTRKIWEPYSEICMSMMRNPGANPMLHKIAFFDRNANTYNGRESFHQFHMKFQASECYVAFRWFVLPDTTLLTAPVICNLRPKLISNLDVGRVIAVGDGVLGRVKSDEVDRLIEDFRSYWIPKVVIEGPDTIKANEELTFKVKCIHQGGKLCPHEHEYMVEALSGFAPHRRLQVRNGQGTCRIIALGLKPGETLRFKINDKYWSGRAEKLLKVV